MWCLVLFFLLNAAPLLASPVHLKLGALTTRLGTVTLVEDALLVRYHFDALQGIPSDIASVTAKLEEAVENINHALDNQAHIQTHLHAATILSMLKARLTYLQITLLHATHDYNVHPVHARSKRGLLNALGRASQYLFGTAMDDDVQDLREHYNKVVTVAAANRKVLNLHNKQISKLGADVQDLLKHANYLTRVLNSAIARLDALTDLFLLDQSLSVLETSLHTVVTNNEAVIRCLVNAANGRVTVEMFPVEDLLYTIDIGRSSFQLQPLFKEESIQYYYPTLEVYLTLDAIVIHVPFKSMDTFEAYQLEPFPFAVNNSIMTLDFPSTLVLVADDLSFYASGRLEDLNECVASFMHVYHCAASLFAFLPIAGGICEVSLIHAEMSDALLWCPYKHLVPKPIFHLAFHGYHYFFFTNVQYLSVICPNGTSYQRVSGHYAVIDSCYVRSANLTTFPTRFHDAFVGNLTPSIYPITTLVNVSFSRISYVTNTISELKFSNHSELSAVLEDYLPEYLNPVYVYPSFLIPLAIIIIILIPLCCYVQRALSLYNRLESERRARAARI